LVPTAELKKRLLLDVTPILPLAVGGVPPPEQPIGVIEKLNEPAWVGVPLMVKVPDVGGVPGA